MSILIKDKALPKTCEECLFYGIDVENGCFVEKCFVLRRAGQDKPSWCPLVPVPPHGRLIDADALMDELQELFDKRCEEAKFSGNRGACVTWNDAICYIKSALTIIEAEEEQE